MVPTAVMKIVYISIFQMIALLCKLKDNQISVLKYPSF